MKRCAWVPDNDQVYAAYHDDEWGVPVESDSGLFELLTLEGAQAGLSWRTILGKRNGYRSAFAGFDPVVVAAFTSEDIERLLADPGIVRHRGKIESTVNNAAAVLTLTDAHGSFADYMWSFIDGRTRTEGWRHYGEIPAQTPLSDHVSKALKKAGFRFVGPTTVYSFLQAAGLVNDHTVDCFRYRALAGASDAS
ncbi:MAG: DNA-3-methyladenine glycosylase I [Acidimicrobiia bacterium]|nr:DNA-3-methyladenine glycosylase I [Acidimicrobiia bacterium]